MKILILMNSLGAGGAERSMVEFGKYLHQHEETDVKFAILERRKIGLEEEVAQSGISISYFKQESSYKNKVKFLLGEVKDFQPDILHSVLAESNIVLRLSRILHSHGRVVQSLVNTPYSLERKKDSKLPWYKFLLAKQFDILTARLTSPVFYHAITHEVLNHYRFLFKIKNNYKVVYRGRYENPFLGQFNNESLGLKLINVGRQEFAKGQLDIVKALGILKQEKGITDIHLEILGRPGHYSEKIREEIQKNGLQSQISIHGFVTDVQKRLAAADVFVFPSYYEGLGGALIEAFSSRLPCICSNIAVLKEVVGSEQGALFGAPGDCEALAANILDLYTNKKKREELGVYAYKRFQDVFRMEKINQEMLDMYNEVLLKSEK